MHTAFQLRVFDRVIVVNGESSSCTNTCKNNAECAGHRILPRVLSTRRLSGNKIWFRADEMR